MGFLSPWFLAAAALVGLPLYLHLLRRHQSEALPFSSLMFFERRTQSSIKHRRLRHLLLLSLRIAVLLLLALVFANPFLNRPVAGMMGNKLVVLVIDNSFSMRAGSRLADAKRAALGVLDARNPGTRAQVMTLGSQLHALTAQTQDSGELRQAVNSVAPRTRAPASVKSRAGCAPSRKQSPSPSRSTSSAIYRNPGCRRAFRKWSCRRMPRLCCTLWSRTRRPTGQWKA